METTLAKLKKDNIKYYIDDLFVELKDLVEDRFEDYSFDEVFAHAKNDEPKLFLPEERQIVSSILRLLHKRLHEK